MVSFEDREDERVFDTVLQEDAEYYKLRLIPPQCLVRDYTELSGHPSCVRNATFRGPTVVHEARTTIPGLAKYWQPLWAQIEHIQPAIVVKSDGSHFGLRLGCRQDAGDMRDVAWICGYCTKDTGLQEAEPRSEIGTP